MYPWSSGLKIVIWNSVRTDCTQTDVWPRPSTHHILCIRLNCGSPPPPRARVSCRWVGGLVLTLGASAHLGFQVPRSRSSEARVADGGINLSACKTAVSNDSYKLFRGRARWKILSDRLADRQALPSLEHTRSHEHGKCLPTGSTWRRCAAAWLDRSWKQGCFLMYW